MQRSLQLETVESTQLCRLMSTQYPWGCSDVDVHRQSDSVCLLW